MIATVIMQRIPPTILMVTPQKEVGNIKNATQEDLDENHKLNSFNNTQLGMTIKTHGPPVSYLKKNITNTGYMAPKILGSIICIPLKKINRKT